MDKSRAAKAALFQPYPTMLRWWPRSHWICVGFGLLTHLTLMPLALMNPDVPLWEGLYAWAFQLTVVSLVVTHVCWGIMAWRVRRAYRAAGGVLCAGCLNPMIGLENQPRCPECGRAYDAQADAALWQNAGIGLRTTDKPKP